LDIKATKRQKFIVYNEEFKEDMKPAGYAREVIKRMDKFVYLSASGQNVNFVYTKLTAIAGGEKS